MNQPPDFDAAFADQLETLFAWRRDVRRFRRESLPPGAVERLLCLGYPEEVADEPELQRLGWQSRERSAG